MAQEANTANRLGFLKFYPGDWLNDNAALTHEEFGVYTRMAFRYWMSDGLPWNPEAIAEDIGDRDTQHIDTINRVLSKKFSKGRGKKWVHAYLDSARADVREYRRRKSGDGSKGNEVRKADDVPD